MNHSQPLKVDSRRRGPQFVLIVALLFCREVIVESWNPLNAAEEISTASPDVQIDDAVQDILFLAAKQPLLIRLHLYVKGEGFRNVRYRWADAQFTVLDVDHNGLLEGDELKRLSAIASVGDGAGPLSGADTDPVDGKVSSSECRRYLMASLESPFSIQSSDNANNVRFINGMQNSPVNLFPKLDLDQDGKLSGPELDSAASNLRRYDRNEDDLITNFELQQSQPEEQAIANQKLSGALSLLAVINPADTTNIIARKLLEHYDKSSRDPVSKSFRKDEKLTQAELKLDPESFQRADHNHDGKLHRAELNQLSSAMVPAIELEIQASTAEGQFTVTSLRSANPSLGNVLNAELNGQGQVVLTLDDMALTLSAQGPVVEAAEKLRKVYVDQFASLDNDNNDYLTLEELRRFGSFTQAFFTQADVDNDEKVFQKEYVAQIDREIELSLTGISWEISGDGRSFFSLVDASPADGSLSLRELSEIPQRLAPQDSNKDGFITLGELAIEMSAIFRSGMPRVNGPFNQLAVVQNRPTDNNGPKTDVPTWFTKMDRNHDGDLSPREFLGRRKLFDEIDVNHDGLISTSEAKSFAPSNRLP